MVEAFSFINSSLYGMTGLEENPWSWERIWHGAGLYSVTSEIRV
jgi:hypothetical protein